MKKHCDGLAAAMAADKLVTLYRRKINKDRLHGYIVGLSDTWVLLNAVEIDTLVLDGYVAIRLGDVSRFTTDNGFVGEYLKLSGVCPQKPSEIDMEDSASMLRSVSQAFSLFMIESEKIEPGIGFVGRLGKLTGRNLWLKKFSSKATWVETEKFKLKDITSINFGGGYVEALAWMDAHNREAAGE